MSTPLAMVRRTAAGWLLPLCLAGAPPPDAVQPLSLSRERFDLACPADLRRLTKCLSVLEHAAERRVEMLETRRRAARAGRPLEQLDARALQAWFQNPPGLPPKREQDLLARLRSMADTLLRDTPDPSKAKALRSDMAEIAAALANASRPPLPRHLPDILIPFRLLQHASLSFRVHRDRNADSQPIADHRFWLEPGSIETADLFHGFDRPSIPALSNDVCAYYAPKTSAGRSAGFTATCRGQEIKIKFREVHSEPFAGRVLHALGYHVEPTDFTPSVRLQYNRRFLREFNLRQPLRFGINAVGLIPVFRKNLQPVHDPFDFVEVACLKDGSRLDGAQLKQRLLLNPSLRQAWLVPDNFNEAFERRLDMLVLKKANLQWKDDIWENVGPWDWAQLGHAGLRPLRGLGVAAAWLGWSDTRFDNTRLKIRRAQTGQAQIAHFLSDTGSGLGRTGLLVQHGEDPNAFPWTFTRRIPHQPAQAAGSKPGAGHLDAARLLLQFQPVEPNAAFDALTWEDARWMARWIGRLTENQLLQALIASGFDSAECRLYLEKLASRRDAMIRDLDLTGEIALWRPGGVNRQFDYNPAKEGPMKARLPDGTQAMAPLTPRRVVRGALCDGPLPVKATASR